MNCKKVLSRLQAYVDGEVPAKLRGEIEEHLGACPLCRSEAERIRKVGDVLDSLSVPPLPEGFSARVMAEARRRAPLATQKRSFLPLEWRPLRWLLDLSAPMRVAACAAVLLACLLGMFMSKELSLHQERQAPVAELEPLDGFEWFSPTPPASLGSVYLTYASVAPPTGENP